MADEIGEDVDHHRPPDIDRARLRFDHCSRQREDRGTRRT